MDLGEKIRTLRLKQGLTLEQVGNIVGVGKSTVRKWESGQIANMRRDKIALIAEALHVSPAYLMGWEENSTPLPANAIPVSKKRIPLLGSIAAGEPILVDQEYDTYIESDEDVHCDYALRVDGDSMEPTILYGDLVFIHAQDDVDDGQIAAVLLDDSATLKRVIHIPNGLQLISDNAIKYPPRLVTLPTEYDIIRILGRAVAYKRML